MLCTVKMSEWWKTSIHIHLKTYKIYFKHPEQNKRKCIFKVNFDAIYQNISYITLSYKVRSIMQGCLIKTKSIECKTTTFNNIKVLVNNNTKSDKKWKHQNRNKIICRLVIFIHNISTSKMWNYFHPITKPIFHKRINSCNP